MNHQIIHDSPPAAMNIGPDPASQSSKDVYITVRPTDEPPSVNAVWSQLGPEPEEAVPPSRAAGQNKRLLFRAS